MIRREPTVLSRVVDFHLRRQKRNLHVFRRLGAVLQQPVTLNRPVGRSRTEFMISYRCSVANYKRFIVSRSHVHGH